MQEEIKKSYNPFKMWGSWFGFGLGILTFPLWEHYGVVSLNPISWIIPFVGDFFSYGIVFYATALFTLPVALFFYGWGINSFFRMIDRENKIVVSLVIFLIVAFPIATRGISDYLALQDTLNHSDLYINSAKVLPEDSNRNASDFKNESISMNAVTETAKAEKNIPLVINKMMSIAGDESLAVDVRLTALESLAPKLDQNKMNTDEKKTLSEKLLLLSSQVNKSTQLNDMNKERMNGRISMLQKML